MKRIVTFQEIITFLDKKQMVYGFKGDVHRNVAGFCSLKQQRSNCLMWIKTLDALEGEQLRYKDNALLVTPEQLSGEEAPNQIITDQPKAVFFSIIEYFWKETSEPGIASTAVVETDKIGENVSIGHHCYIGQDVSIGDNTVIEHGVIIDGDVTIGANCLIHSGVVIGTDGFGFFVNQSDGMPVKVEHFGGVEIGNEVEIGANTCVDRGTIDNTIIRDRVKIDNLVHIAHNVVIGEGSMVVALSLLGGSAELGVRSYVAPGVMIKNQIHLGEGAFAGMGAVVIDDIPAGMVAAGVPATVIRKVKNGDK